MRLSVLLQTLVLAATAAAVEDIVVEEGHKYSEGEGQLDYGSASIYSYANWTIVDTNLTFEGEFQNNGVLYFVSESEETSFDADMDQNYFRNNGDLVFVGNSTKTPDIRINDGQFENRGRIFLVGPGGLQESSARIIPETLENRGEIAFYQDRPSDTILQFGRRDHTVFNLGLICLVNSGLERNAKWTIDAGEVSEGCIDIGDDSVVYHPFGDLEISNQTHFFSGAGGAITVGYKEPPVPYVVRNWAGENVLGVVGDITNLDYADGILKISAGGSVYPFDIGTGYDDSKFEIVSTADFEGGSSGKSGVVYNGKAPSSSRPKACGECPEVPSQPERE